MERLFLIRRLITLLLLLGLCGCTGLFFHPYRPHVRTPADIGLAYEDVYFPSADGVRLHGWFLPARSQACATVLFLHGNAENISTHIGSVYWMPARGFNVFLPDYSGYGASDGLPTQKGMQLDVEGAMRHLLSRGDIDTNRLIVFGQSLGGATAIYYVANTPHRNHIRLLAIDSAFSSYRDIAREKLGEFWLTWLFQWPFALTVSDDYRPLSAVPQIAPIPLLLMHGDSDVVVPIAHGERLYQAAREPKEFWRIEGAGHLQILNNKAQQERFAAYLQQHVCPR